MSTPSPLPPLAPFRVHEVCGPSAASFALIAGSQRRNIIIWGQLTRLRDRILPTSAVRILTPDQLVLISATSEAELLWATEEALRSGAAGLVIAAPEKPLSLIAGRRLQLAAEAGRTTGILITGLDGGSNAAETRWHCAPLWNGQDSTLQEWRIIKNKKGTLGAWTVKWDEKARSLRVVAATGQRSILADTPL